MHVAIRYPPIAHRFYISYILYHPDQLPTLYCRAMCSEGDCWLCVSRGIASLALCPTDAL